MTVKTIKRTGREFKLVNDLPAETLQDFLKAVDQFQQDPEAFRFEHRRLGSGACGAVYSFNDKYALKVNSSGWGERCEDGVILESLQGVPLVPTLYAYSTDNKFTLVQRINGATMQSYLGNPWREFAFDEDAWLKASELFYEYTKERGWIAKDLHSENLMIDTEGKIWVIDFGLFARGTKDSWVGGSREVDDFIVQVQAILTGTSPDWDKVGMREPDERRTTTRDFFTSQSGISF